MKRKQIIALVLSAVLAAGSAMPGSVLPAAAAEKESTVYDVLLNTTFSINKKTPNAMYLIVQKKGIENNGEEN